MNVNEYLSEVLKSQELEKEDLKSLTEHRNEVESYLREKFGDDPVIKYAGSYAKDTMIKESYDLDIVCYFSSLDERTLKEIHDDVEICLKEQYLVEDKASAVRILNLKENGAPVGYHIDVVPGRFIEDSSDVFLHVTYGDKKRIQTNLKTHINHISNSNCVDVIKLVKLWNNRNNLTIRTFILELFVVKSLLGFRQKADSQKAFLKVLESFKDDFKNMELIDPANSNNVVSSIMTTSHKNLVAKAAENTLSIIEESENISDWKSVFKDDSQNSTNAQPTSINNPHGQWAL